MPLLTDMKSETLVSRHTTQHWLTAAWLAAACPRAAGGWSTLYLVLQYPESHSSVLMDGNSVYREFRKRIYTALTITIGNGLQPCNLKLRTLYADLHSRHYDLYSLVRDGFHYLVLPLSTRQVSRVFPFPARFRWRNRWTQNGWLIAEPRLGANSDATTVALFISCCRWHLGSKNVTNGSAGNSSARASQTRWVRRGRSATLLRPALRLGPTPNSSACAARSRFFLAQSCSLLLACAVVSRLFYNCPILASSAGHVETSGGNSGCIKIRKRVYIKLCYGNALLVSYGC